MGPDDPEAADDGGEDGELLADGAEERGRAAVPCEERGRVLAPHRVVRAVVHGGSEEDPMDVKQSLIRGNISTHQFTKDDLNQNN